MRAYHLVEAHEVTRVVGKFYLAFPRFHDLFDDLTWRLCHDPLPDEAVEIAPKNFLIKRVDLPYPGFCVTLVYAVDSQSETITIVEMRIDESIAVDQRVAEVDDPA